MRLVNAFLVLFLFIQAAQAAKVTPVVPVKKAEKSHWNGSQVRLGLNINTGNTDTSEGNAALDLDYAKYRWKNALSLTAAFGKASGVLNKQRFTARNELKYGFNATRNHFLFLRGGWIGDQFSPYSYQSTVAAGYGLDLVDTDTTTISLQVGPGYRNDKVRGSGAVEERLIGTLQSNIKIHIGKGGLFKEVFQYDSGPPFHYIDSKTSFTSAFMTHWSLQAAFEAEYYSRIPPMSSHTKKLDTTTTLALVYNF